ncbi:MAG: DUF6062 family protein [Defluviitaleaceae bacterium]|nr:DUF6062 family protein [Defluviitaleaceae bacterium]
MAEHIHTIPVLDALRDPKGCAFCQMQAKLDNDIIQFIMGPAYMEDDVRMATNKAGFCQKHMQAMYKEQNRLGLALMLHTHMQRLCKDTGNIIEGRIPLPLFGKDKNAMLPRLTTHLENTKDSCYVCSRTDKTFDRYVDTFFHIWGQGGEGAKLIANQESYCLPHFITLLEAAEKLGRGKKEKFLDIILPLWQKTTKELEADLDWFVQKFDHRNANEPWKNSKDAVPRAIDFLGGADA